MSNESELQPKVRPATTPEARYNQLIALSIDAAENQIRNGTASSQIIHFFLREGSEKTRNENEKLKHEVEKLKAQTEELKAAKKVEELYADAISAMRKYQGVMDDL